MGRGMQLAPDQPLILRPRGVGRGVVALALGIVGRSTLFICDRAERDRRAGSRRMPPILDAAVQSGWTRLTTVWEVSLLSRIFLANSAIILVAAGILLFTPATVSSPPHLREVAVVLGGLSAILTINLLLLRRALTPLERLTSLMRTVELLKPGRRVPVYGQGAEILDLTRAFNEMLDRLEAERQESVRRSVEAQESERRRVAQELHDEVGQTLTAVLLQLDRLARLVSEDLRAEVADVREAARSSLDELRAISKRLRPEALDDLGLPNALAALTDRLSEQTGASIERRIDQDVPPLGPEVELVVYRVAQEALTNALRHAQALTISLMLERGAEGAVLVVCDDGRGLHASHPGAGIQGMRERVLSIGGELRLESHADGGTQLTLQVKARAGGA